MEEVSDFAAVVGGRVDKVLCTGDDGTAAVEVTRTAALSGKTGRPVAIGQVLDDCDGV
jgi:hypothetical protein